MINVQRKIYVIEEFTEKKYHYNEEGEIDEVVNLIDCWDQILYVILFNRDIDIVDFFCGDINPEFYEYEEQFGLRILEENVNSNILRLIRLKNKKE